MNLAQENFDRAVSSGRQTVVALAKPRGLNQQSYLDLSQESTTTLRAMVWDLEAIGAAIRLELMNREDKNPVDLG